MGRSIWAVAVFLACSVVVAQPRPRRLPSRRYPPPATVPMVATAPIPEQPVPAPLSPPPVAPTLIAPPVVAVAASAPADHGTLTIGILGGYATPPSNYPEVMGVGLGICAGYSFRNHFSLAIEYNSYFGGSGYYFIPRLGVSTATTTSNMYAGAQIGYDGIAGPIRIRPYALAGRIGETHKCSACSGPAESEGLAAVGIGLGIHALFSMLFAGVEGRAMVIEARGVSVVVFGTVGVRIRL